MSAQRQEEEVPADVARTMQTAGIRVGAPVRTKFMRPFVSRASSDGLYIIDLDKTIGRIRAAARFIERTGAAETIVYSGKEYAQRPVERLCGLVGARPMSGRFMPGTLTNPSLPYYTEPRLMVVSDPQVDSQAITEATNAGIPVVSLANTDNVTSNVDLVVPANNKGRKALAAVYWLLAREILVHRGDISGTPEMPQGIDDFETKPAAGAEE